MIYETEVAYTHPYLGLNYYRGYLSTHIAERHSFLEAVYHLHTGRFTRHRDIVGLREPYSGRLLEYIGKLLGLILDEDAGEVIKGSIYRDVADPLSKILILYLEPGLREDVKILIGLKSSGSDILSVLEMVLRDKSRGLLGEKVLDLGLIHKLFSLDPRDASRILQPYTSSHRVYILDYIRGIARRLHREGGYEGIGCILDIDRYIRVNIGRYLARDIYTPMILSEVYGIQDPLEPLIFARGLGLIAYYNEAPNDIGAPSEIIYRGPIGLERLA